MSDNTISKAARVRYLNSRLNLIQTQITQIEHEAICYSRSFTDEEKEILALMEEEKDQIIRQINDLPSVAGIVLEFDSITRAEGKDLEKFILDTLNDADGAFNLKIHGTRLI